MGGTINLIFTCNEGDYCGDKEFNMVKDLITEKFIPKFNVVDNNYYHNPDTIFFNIEDTNTDEVIDTLVSILKDNISEWDYTYDKDDEFIHDGYCEFTGYFKGVDFILQYYFEDKNK